MSTDPTAVVPPTFRMSAAEEQTISIDLSECLQPGDSVTAMTAALTSVDDGTVVTLTNAASLVGSVVWQTFDGASDTIVAGEAYRYRVTFTASFTGNRFVRDLIVRVAE